MNSKAILSADECLALIEQGSSTFNQWRSMNPEIQVDLSGQKLDKYDLSGYNLSHALLVGTSFIDANLTDADLSGANCSNARFIAAILDGTRFDNANLTDADFLAAMVRRISLVGLDLRNIDMKSFNLRYARLERVDLRGQSLSHMDLTGASLAGADLSGIDLVGANLTGADFTNAVLNESLLQEANLTKAILNRASLQKIRARKAIFREARCACTDFRHADLREVAFEQANLTGARFHGATTDGWILRGVECEYCYWDPRGHERQNFRRGEFERLYGLKPTIVLKYPGTIRWHELATLPFLAEHLAASQWGTLIHLKKIEERPSNTDVIFSIEEVGDFEPERIRQTLQQEAENIQAAQLEFRTNPRLYSELKQALSKVKEQFWPRMLELAGEHGAANQRNLTVLFMDLKGFSRWQDSELSIKLDLFRGLLKPILDRWQASYPNMEGDSLRATFRNAAAGIQCALMVQRVLSAAGFELRIGMDTGPVIVAENAVTGLPDLGGYALNFAARLEEVAKTGEVLVSHRVQQLARTLRDHVRFVPREVTLHKPIGELEAGSRVTAYVVSDNTQ